MGGMAKSTYERLFFNGLNLEINASLPLRVFPLFSSIKALTGQSILSANEETTLASEALGEKEDRKKRSFKDVVLDTFHPHAELRLGKKERFYNWNLSTDWSPFFNKTSETKSLLKKFDDSEQNPGLVKNLTDLFTTTSNKTEVPDEKSDPASSPAETSSSSQPDERQSFVTLRADGRYLREDMENLKSGIDMKISQYFKDLKACGTKIEVNIQRVKRVIRDTQVSSFNFSYSINPNCIASLAESQSYKIFIAPPKEDEKSKEDKLCNVAIVRHSVMREVMNLSWLIGMPILSVVCGLIGHVYAAQFIQDVDCKVGRIEINGGVHIVLGFDLLGQILFYVSIGIDRNGRIFWSVGAIQQLNRYGPEMLSMNA